MSGYAGGYAISPFPTGPGVGTEATDKAVLYWDGVNNLVKGSADFIFNDTLKQIQMANGSAASPSYSFINSPGTGMYRHGSDILGFSAAGFNLLKLSTSGFQLADNALPLMFGSAADVVLYRDAANVLAQRNGTSAQAFRLYNTYTDINNYERLRVAWDSNAAYVQVQKSGTGTARTLYLESAADLYLRAIGTAQYFYVNGAYRTYLASTAFNPYSDAQMYLGDSTHRWLSGWFGGAAAYVPITAKLHASQTANALEVQNSSGTPLSRIKSDGRWRHDGATTWNDLRIEPVARSTGANAPSFEKYFDDVPGSSRGVYLYSFNDATAGSEKEIFFTMQMPHDWKEGTAIHLHCHWVGSVSDTTSAPRWGLEYTWKDIGQVFGDTTIVYSSGSNIDGSGSSDPNITAGKHYISEFTAITPGTDANNISSIIIGRLFRDSANAGDTYNAATNKCGLLYIDAHYEVDSFGSDTEFTKD